MGITFSEINKLEEVGVIDNKCLSILDIGSSNLYGAGSEQVKTFLSKYNNGKINGIDELSERLAKGSAYDEVTGGLNDAFVGELFEKAGMEYLSFDIAEGYNTKYLDLNTADLPDIYHNKFDVVLNYGTTEHLMNQYNAFKVIHEATKLGGYIVHSLPAVGFLDHGYITYTGRFFFDLAGHNEYEIIGFDFHYNPAPGNIYQSLRSYKSYFPELEKSLSKIESDELSKQLDKLEIPDISIFIIYKKVKDIPYRGTLESSTSVGNLSKDILLNYKNIVSASAVKPVASFLKDKITSFMKILKNGK